MAVQMDKQCCADEGLGGLSYRRFPRLYLPYPQNSEFQKENFYDLWMRNLHFIGMKIII